MRRLKHSKSTLAEGVSFLVGLGLFVIGLGCFQIFFFPAMWAEDPWLVLAFLAIEAMLGGLGIYYSLMKIRRNETFLCLLEDGVLQCICPVPRLGDSFKIGVADIRRIDKEAEPGDSWRWYLVDAEGGRYWLTSHYHNPAEKFVSAIRQLNPEIIQTGEGSETA